MAEAVKAGDWVLVRVCEITSRKGSIYRGAIEDKLYYVIGFSANGIAVLQDELGILKYHDFEDNQRYRVLVDCSGWGYVKPKKPVESPDDWVTQDKVPPRAGKDWCWWGPVDEFTQWWGVYNHHAKDVKGLVHGENHKTISDLKLNVRCRRKDLPKPTRKIVLHKWLVEEVGWSYIRISDKKPNTKAYATVHDLGPVEYEIPE